MVPGGQKSLWVRYLSLLNQNSVIVTLPQSQSRKWKGKVLSVKDIRKRG